MKHGDDLFVIHPNAQEQRIRELRKEIKELRKEVLDAGDAGARLINEARRTATDCADIVNFYHPNGKALEAIRKKFNL